MQKIRHLMIKLANERGDLAEELLILPLKVFILIFIIEMGILIINYQFFVESFGTAMRRAEIEGCVNTTVENAAKNHLQSLTQAINVDEVVITGTPNPVNYGDPIEVEMEYTYHYRIIDPVLQVINKEITFHPVGYTTSSHIIR